LPNSVQRTRRLPPGFCCTADEGAIMSKPPALTPEEARRKAEDRFKRAKQRDAEAQTAYEELAKQQKAEAAKTDRLKALRLAKEAADAEIATRAAAEKAAAGEAARKRKAERAAPAKPKSELV
jgi:hypothetical protein